VVRHDHEFMQQKSLLLAMMLADIKKEMSHLLRPKNRPPTPSDSSHKEGTKLLFRKSHLEPGLKARHTNRPRRRAEALLFHRSYIPLRMTARHTRAYGQNLLLRTLVLRYFKWFVKMTLPPLRATS